MPTLVKSGLTEIKEENEQMESDVSTKVKMSKTGGIP